MVVLASIAVALAASTLERRFPALRDSRRAGRHAWSRRSSSSRWRRRTSSCSTRVARLSHRCARRGGHSAAELDAFLARRGLLGRLFRPLFRLIGAPWHMYPLGFLFGLGFDTATEIALLGIAAAEAAKGLPIWSILVFPALFTAGMALVDTTDSVLMVGAYGWAFVKPMRKLYYNLTITLVSVLVAVAVGGIEVLGLVADRLGGRGRSGRWSPRLNDNFSALGYVIIAIFAASWLVSALIYRLRGLDKIEAVEG